MPFSVIFFIIRHADAVKAGIPIDVIWDLDQRCGKGDESACVCMKALSSISK